MPIICARVPSIDWDRGFPRHWNAGDPALTHPFNALSLLFPIGERYFIDVVREVAADPRIDLSPELEQEIKGFIAQEAIHGRQHSLYNAELARQGFANVVEDLLLRLQVLSRKRLSPLARLAIVCGYEHFTAIIGEHLLSKPQLLATASPEMALAWGWHAVEETEHKGVCFELYRTAGGGWLTRALTFCLVALVLSYTFFRQYSSILLRDGSLRRGRILRFLRSSSGFFLGRSGIAWWLLARSTHYLSPRFHPLDADDPSRRELWLTANRTKLRVVGA